MDTVFFVAAKLAGFVLLVESWLLALALAAFWAGLRRRAWLQHHTSGGLVLAVLALGLFPFGDALLRPLETGFPAFELTAADPGEIDGIIVLGGSEDVPASRQSAQPELGESAERYLAALALARRRPEARLLFTGGGGRLRDVGGGAVAEADIARRIFADHGIAPHRLLFENRSRNTTENARLGYALAAPKTGEQWVLITSAFHMPRAVSSFAAAGWPGIIPYPVDFRTRAFSDGLGWNFQRNLGLINVALREWVGRAAYAAVGR